MEDNTVEELRRIIGEVAAKLEELNQKLEADWIVVEEMRLRLWDKKQGQRSFLEVKLKDAKPSDDTPHDGKSIIVPEKV